MQNNPQYIEQLTQPLMDKLGPKAGGPHVRELATQALTLTATAITQVFGPGGTGRPETETTGWNIETASAPIVLLAGGLVRAYFAPFYAASPISVPTVEQFAAAVKQGIDWATITTTQRARGGTGGTSR